MHLAASPDGCPRNALTAPLALGGMIKQTVLGVVSIREAKQSIVIIDAQAT